MNGLLKSKFLGVTKRKSVSFLLLDEEIQLTTLQYYNENAQSFYDRTIDLSMLDFYGKFLELLPKQGKILDAGCGVGRDAKYFMEQGYQVIAFDASEEMVRLSTQELKQPTLHLSFQNINFPAEFDGVWANASLLHVPYEETRIVFEKVNGALKPGGIFYATYKYGNQKQLSKGRDFYDMNEETILPYLDGLFDALTIREVADTRDPILNQGWLHVLCKKKGLPT